MTDDASAKLEFHLEGDPSEEGLVLAEDFVAFLSKALNTLKLLEADRGRKPAGSYRIVELEIGSAVVTIEATTGQASYAPEVFGDFLEGFAALRDGTLKQKRFSAATQKAFQSLAQPLKKKHLRHISVRSDAIKIDLRHDAAALQQPTPGPEVHAVGAIAGYIEALNVHKEPVFFLYPEVGPARIRCLFARNLLDDVRAAIKRFVTVHGLYEYPEGSPFASRVTVERIELHPPVEELPTLQQLFGSLPELTGGLDSVTYVRTQRDAEA